MADYGRELSGVDDLSFSLHEVKDLRLGVAQAIVHRLQTQVLFYDDEYGYDLRLLLNGSFDERSDFGRLEDRIEEEAGKDERVQAASASVAFISGSGTLRVGIQIELDEQGEFEMTLEVSALTVELLSIG